jgi:hypothetical protein
MTCRLVVPGLHRRASRRPQGRNQRQIDPGPRPLLSSWMPPPHPTARSRPTLHSKGGHVARASMARPLAADARPPWTRTHDTYTAHDARPSRCHRNCGRLPQGLRQRRVVGVAVAVGTVMVAAGLLAAVGAGRGTGRELEKSCPRFLCQHRIEPHARWHTGIGRCSHALSR